MKNTNTAFRFLVGLFVCFLSTTSILFAISGATFDDFESGTAENWQGRFPTNIPNGGPLGAGDNYLQVYANGQNGASGGNLTIYNRSQWIGDYLTNGITGINLDLRNFDATPFSIRIGFKQNTTGSSPGYLSSTPFVLANDGLWHNVTFAIDTGSLTRINSTNLTLTSILSAQAELRIFHSQAGDSFGETVLGTLGVDNIRAVPEPASWSVFGICAIVLFFRLRKRISSFKIRKY